MATFSGTLDEFHHFIGPRIRNRVNLLTKPYRKALDGGCQHCGKMVQLDSAHVLGKDRRTLIENALRLQDSAEGVFTVALQEIEQQIVQAHLPIESTFKFLCRKCHNDYDQTGLKSDNASKPTETGRQDFQKINRIELWSRRPNQINHKIIRAFLELDALGVVSTASFQAYCRDSYQIANFNAHFASLKTDTANSHGKVFYEQNGYVFLYDRVRSEIELHFNVTL